MIPGSLLENTGSTARDLCMLERNVLSHVKLALLFSLLSSSVLLRAQLVPSEDSEPGSGLPLAVIQFIASLASIAAGFWEYYSGFRNFGNMRAFLVDTKPHFAVMIVIAGVVFASCVILLAEANS